MLSTALGRRGFRYDYPAGTAAFAAAMFRELPRYGELDLAAKGAFARGTSPGTTEVLVRLLDPPAEADEVLKNPQRAAARMANKGSRRASTSPGALQVKQSLDRPGQLADFFRAAFGSVFSGDTSGFGHALRLLHVSENVAAELTQGIEEEFGGPENLRRAFDVWKDVLRQASMAEFERARDDAVRIYQGSLQVMGTLAGMLGAAGPVKPDEVEALGMVPFMLLVRKQEDDEAADELVRMWGEPLTYIGRVVDSLKAWASDHPDEAGILWPIGRTLLERSLGP